MSLVDTDCSNGTNTPCDDLITCLITQRPVALSIARAMREFGMLLPSDTRKFYCSARLVSRAWRSMEQEWATCVMIVRYTAWRFFHNFETYNAVMRNIYVLNLQSCCLNNGDVLILGNTNISTISLSDSRHITNVEPLARHKYIKLSMCSELREVSPLKHAHSLYLTRCKSLVDVSALGHVHRLSLAACYNVCDVSALGTIHTLDLTDCIGISDVSALGHVHTLNLSRCRNVTNVSALGKVHNLDLSMCSRVVDVSALGTVHVLLLVGCMRIVDVTALHTVKWLNLSYCCSIRLPENLPVALCKVARLLDCHGRAFACGFPLSEGDHGWAKTMKIFE